MDIPEEDVELVQPNRNSNAPTFLRRSSKHVDPEKINRENTKNMGKSMNQSFRDFMK